MENFITQYPTPPNEWLYKDENENRLFSDYVIRPNGSKPWSECTTAEKEEWEQSHPQPQPEEPMEDSLAKNRVQPKEEEI